MPTEQEKKIRRLQDALNDASEALGYGHPRETVWDIVVEALTRDPVEEEDIA